MTGSAGDLCRHLELERPIGRNNIPNSQISKRLTDGRTFGRVIHTAAENIDAASRAEAIANDCANLDSFAAQISVHEATNTLATVFLLISRVPDATVDAWA